MISTQTDLIIVWHAMIDYFAKISIFRLNWFNFDHIGWAKWFFDIEELKFLLNHWTIELFLYNHDTAHFCLQNQATHFLYSVPQSFPTQEK